MHLTSPAFENNGVIPEKYTCNGEGISPTLKWSSVPKGTISFVLLCEDPDVPRKKEGSRVIWDHWLVYNIPAGVWQLEEAIRDLPKGSSEGLTSWGKPGYGGPCPPDREHRYFFKLYALDALLSFNQTPTKAEVEEAMRGHILAEAILIGRYAQPQHREIR